MKSHWFLKVPFSRILVPTCFHFGPQVEVQNRCSLELEFEISARGFQEAPRASQEGPRASQEAPRASQEGPRALPERPKRVQVTPKTAPGAPKSSQDSKIKVAPYKNMGKLKKTPKMDENIESLRKSGQELQIWL